jgi:hypothetical protein
MCVDKLNFNADGTIQIMVQTQEGVPRVGPASTFAQEAIKYGAAGAVAAHGAQLEDDPAAADGKSIHGLHLADSYFEFSQVSGGQGGGRATIGIHFAAKENAKLALVVNGINYSFLNTPATGGWDVYQGQAGLTVPLGAGSTNVIRLSGGHGGVNVDYLTVNLLDEALRASRGGHQN